MGSARQGRSRGAAVGLWPAKPMRRLTASLGDVVAAALRERTLVWLSASTLYVTTFGMRYVDRRKSDTARTPFRDSEVEAAFPTITRMSSASSDVTSRDWGMCIMRVNSAAASHWDIRFTLNADDADDATVARMPLQ